MVVALFINHTFLCRYLFPEATPLWQPAASHCAMEAALEHVASDPGMRREALQLVQFLMTACPSNLEQGLRDLAVLHYDNGLRIIDRKWVVSVLDQGKSRRIMEGPCFGNAVQVGT